MIVAGIGCRAGVDTRRVLAAIDAALAARALPRAALSMVATVSIKAREAGVIAAARELDLPLIVVAADELARADARTLTNSPASRDATGTGSASEAAALAAAGSASRLLGPRIARDGVTCALAIAGDPS